MRKGLLLLAGVAVLWVPAVAGGSSRRPASKPAKTKASSHNKGDKSSPARACKGQLGGKGHGGAGANAFGKCVSRIARHKSERNGKDSAAESQDKDSAESQDKHSANPAMTCRAMQANDLAHFQTTYGTRPNAFGKCVARQAASRGDALSPPVR